MGLVSGVRRGYGYGPCLGIDHICLSGDLHWLASPGLKQAGELMGISVCEVAMKGLSGNCLVLY